MIGYTQCDVEAAHRAIVFRCGGSWSDYGDDAEISDDPADRLKQLESSTIGRRLSWKGD